MLRRTHLVIGLAVAIYFLKHVSNELIFFLVVMVSTLLPDIDSGTSALGKKWFSKPLQAVSGHRGFLHSYTFCVLVSILLAFFYPSISLAFFLGYSFHLFADSFTVMGIRPIWPLKYVSKGTVSTGGKVEDVIFWVFVFINVFLIVFLFI